MSRALYYLLADGRRGRSMLTKAKLADESIVDVLRNHYHIEAATLTFLPIGNDAKAWVYRVETGQCTYFLKLRKGKPPYAGLLAPHYLHNIGIENVVAPIRSVSGELCVDAQDFLLILYAWKTGESAWKSELSLDQWRDWGGIMRSIHDATITDCLKALVPREQYGQKWMKRIDLVRKAVMRGKFADEIARQTAEVWREKTHDIDLSRRRYLDLGARFAALGQKEVLCHADSHTANIIIDETGFIHIVDWDEVMIAPKERDLMFFINDGQSAEETAAFMRGYGDCVIEIRGLAYYRYDWVMQELCDYGERLLLSAGLSDIERRYAFDEFCRLFVADDVVGRAHQAYADSG